MTLTVDIEKSCGKPIEGFSHFDPHQNWGEYGLYLINKEKRNISFLNFGKVCRDLFFRKLAYVFTDNIQKDGFVHLALAVPKKLNIKSEIVQFQKDYYKIPYVDMIQFEIEDSPIICKSRLADPLTLAPGKSIKDVELNFYLLEIKVPVQLFADISIIWALTWYMRYIILDLGDIEDYKYYLHPYMELLTNCYHDLILTDKTNLIIDTWKLYKNTPSDFITNWNGPYGIHQYYTKFHNWDDSKDSMERLMEKFDLHHKYLNADLLVSYIDSQLKK